MNTVTDERQIEGSRWAQARRRYPNLSAVVTVWLVFVAVLLFGLVAGWVTRVGQLETALLLASFAAIVALGQHLVILTGGIDLSIPFALTASAILLTDLSNGPESMIWVIPATLIFATLVGAWNGFGVAILRVSPLIMTLSTNIILLGMVLAYTQGTPQGLAPDPLVNFITGSIGPIKTPIVIAAVITVLVSLLLLRTSFGRYVFAVGNNPDVAYLSGVSVKRVLIGVYALAGLAYGLAAVMLCGWTQQASFQLGDPYLFPSIAAVVLGGTSILGGRGNYLGTVGGAAVFVAIGTVFAGTNVPESTRNIVIGVVVILAVTLIQRERVTE